MKSISLFAFWMILALGYSAQAQAQCQSVLPGLKIPDVSTKGTFATSTSGLDGDQCGFKTKLKFGEASQDVEDNLFSAVQEASGAQEGDWTGEEFAGDYLLPEGEWCFGRDNKGCHVLRECLIRNEESLDFDYGGIFNACLSYTCDLVDDFCEAETKENLESDGTISKEAFDAAQKQRELTQWQTGSCEAFDNKRYELRDHRSEKDWAVTFRGSIFELRAEPLYIWVNTSDEGQVSSQGNQTLECKDKNKDCISELQRIRDLIKSRNFKNKDKEQGKLVSCLDQRLLDFQCQVLGLGSDQCQNELKKRATEKRRLDTLKNSVWLPGTSGMATVLDAYLPSGSVE